jgi:hypothetical protein
MDKEKDINILTSRLVYLNPDYNPAEEGSLELISVDSGDGTIEISLIATSGSIVVDSSEDILLQDFEIGEDGIILTQLRSDWITNTLRRFIEKYKNSGWQVQFKVIINLNSGNFPKNVYKDVIYFNFIDLKVGSFEQSNGANNIRILTDSQISNNIFQIKANFKTVEEDYILAKKQYEAQLKSNIDLEINTVNVYEPTTFKNVITRLLEFQEGTINPSLDYTKVAGLDSEYKKLEVINRLINGLTRMYPKITIKDGEGIPYSKEGFVEEKISK